MTKTYKKSKTYIDTLKVGNKYNVVIRQNDLNLHGLTERELNIVLSAEKIKNDRRFRDEMESVNI